MKKIICSIVLTALVMSAIFGVIIGHINSEHKAKLEAVSEYVTGDGIDLLHDQIDGTIRDIAHKARNKYAFIHELNIIEDTY